MSEQTDHATTPATHPASGPATDPEIGQKTGRKTGQPVGQPTGQPAGQQTDQPAGQPAGPGGAVNAGHVIDPRLDLAGAQGAKDALVATLAGLAPDARLALDLAGPAPTQVALQLLIAGAAAASARDAGPVLGPHAAAALETLTRQPEETA